ncbi:hypothetical protein CRG98_001540 [Punica granatum]|uniref:Uncharacterized protein n=1 Tax=Punica granatum TaxID=22663 RepID=A0A2I0LBM6_PUNGR|nr:hypothetical protein CRG98_001540 [Punica granatum]
MGRGVGEGQEPVSARRRRRPGGREEQEPAKKGGDRARCELQFCLMREEVRIEGWGKVSIQIGLIQRNIALNMVM